MSDNQVTVIQQTRRVEVSTPGPVGNAGPQGDVGATGPAGPTGPPSDWDASSQGLLGQNFDPIYAGANLTIGTSGQPYLMKTRVLQDCTPTGIITLVGAALSYVPTVGRNFFGLYDANFNLVAETADLSSQLSTTGTKNFPFVTPPVLTAGYYYIVTLMNGTGAFQFTTVSGSSAGRTNVGLTNVNYRAAEGLTGNIALPPTILPGDLSTNAAFWIGLY